MAPGPHHRAGSLRQSNKKNKRTKASKRSIARSAGGKVDSTAAAAAHPPKGGGGGGAAASSASALLNQSKANRRNHQQQLRDAKRQELMRKKRGGGAAMATAMATASRSVNPRALNPPSIPPPPRVVGIISLGASLDVEEQVRECLAGAADKTVRLSSTRGGGDGAPAEGASSSSGSSGSRIVTCKYNAHKRDGHLMFLTCQSSTLPSYTAPRRSDGVGGDDDRECECEARDGLGHAATRETACVLAALDLARVCDVLLFVIDGHGPRLDRDVTEIRIGSAGSGSVATTKTGPDYDHLISSRGDRILAALKGQGLPTPITVLAHTDASGEGGADHPLGDDDDDDDGDERMTYRSVKSQRRAGVKRKLELRKYVGRFATTEFGTGHDRVVELRLTQPIAAAADDSVSGTHCTTSAGLASDGASTVQSAPPAVSASAAALVRTLCFLSCSPPKWVSQSPRSYLLPDSVRYDAASQQLQLTGYVRGLSPLSVNSLMHVPNLGTFPIHSVSAAASAPPLSRHYQEGDGSNKMDVTLDAAPMTTHTQVLYSDPDRQESLNMFASPDALDGEQNLVGFDDDMKGNDGENDDEPVTRPAGWSDYQAAWLDAVDNDDGDDDQAAVDRGELARELNQKAPPPSAQPPSMAMRSDVTMATGMEVDLDDANEVNKKDKEALMEQRRKEQKENLDFPDEVQVEEDQNASERFARYRSLKSFRKSYWDPKENLPETYSSIFHFSNFRATQRSILNDCKERIRAAERVGYFWGSTPQVPQVAEERATDVVMVEDDESVGDGADDDSKDVDDDLLLGCVPAGSYVTVTLRDVKVAPVDDACMTAVSLLPHENKASVLHMAVSRHNDNSEHSTSALVKSKDVVTFRCGWRTWQGRPVFSQLNLNCDKHPLERFLPVFGAASVFGPVTYTPAPVLMFVNDRVVAMGSVVSADANRLILKRIVLTGYPVKVHKRHAVVKYMFYNPADVQWFQPAGLYTKHGLQGNILSSVGEHGTMKCLFHAPIKQHDTVCLPLYKRVYPKYVDDQDGKSKVALDVR